MAVPEPKELHINLPQPSMALQIFGDVESMGQLEAALAQKKISIQFAFNNTTAFAESKALKFLRLTAEWRKNTRYKSSFRQIVLDPAYQRIIMMGEEAIPLILSELQRKP